jgi:hypothetical protein
MFVQFLILQCWQFLAVQPLYLAVKDSQNSIVDKFQTEAPMMDKKQAPMSVQKPKPMGLKYYFPWMIRIIIPGVVFGLTCFSYTDYFLI